MPKRITYIIGLGLIIAGSFVAYLQSAGKYGVNTQIAAILFLVLGMVGAAILNQTVAHNQNKFSFLFSLLASLCILPVVYFLNRSTGKASLMLASVYAGCFLLPSVVLQNWYVFKLAFQPVEISSWLLPAPSVKNNVISLHLNSIRFAFSIAPVPGVETQNYPVTAPGIKTLGVVFSELVHESKDTEQSDEFSDIRDNQYGWTFYVREFAGLTNRQLDANLSLLDNRLKNNAVVTALRQ